MSDTATTTPRGMISPRAYAWLTIGLCLVITVVVGTFNGLVDPYDYFNIDLPWLNAKKNVAYKQDRIFKIRDVVRLRPSVSVIGTSRLGLGMHHSHRALGPDSYNMGLAGAEIYECFRNLQHLQAIQPQKRVVLGLDFIQFNRLDQPVPLFKEDRLRLDRNGNLNPASYYADVPAILWSTDACQDSWTTIAQTRNPHQPAWCYDRGTFDQQAMQDWGAKAVPANLRGQITNSGEWAFYQLLNDFINKYLHFAYLDDAGRAPKLDAFRDILAFARREGIDLHIFITPIHARLGEVYRVSGNWEAFEQWKRDLAALVAEEAVASGREPFPLWDFATWSMVSQEIPPKPTADKEAAMVWYWEASHFKIPLGNLVLDQMFDIQTAPIPVPDDFGTQLNGIDMEAHLAEVERRYQAWRAQDGFAVKVIQVFYTVIRHNLEGHPLPKEFQEMAKKMQDMLQP